MLFLCAIFVSPRSGLSGARDPSLFLVPTCNAIAYLEQCDLKCLCMV